MTTIYRTYTFASTYGSSTYNTGDYNGTNVTNTGTSTGAGSAGGAGATATGGSLSNTGVLVGLIVGVAAATLLVSMIVRIWRRPKQATQPVMNNDSQE
jgi:hypothetical protein